ncbi:MAG: serine hydrolase [Acidobacteria bacterium]|nr:serine hydrolase [Acidobacteriota bacterium]
MITRILLLLTATIAATAQTGTAVPELAAFDRATLAALQNYKVPGASVAIAKDGKLVYARGFGVADLVSGEPVQPDSLFRIASVSKPITAMAVLKLVEEGKVSLDTKLLPFIGRKATGDPRYNDITVRHLLQHSAGMDIFTWNLDPSFPDRATLDALGANLPPSRGDILEFVLANLPLAFAPGTNYAYSNIGYMFLTDVIEKATGQPYESYMREKILAPLGISRMFVAGSLLSERRPGEVRYWDKDRVDAPIFPNLPAQVPQPYGTFNIRIFESGGGWLASTPDLVRFLTAFDSGSGVSLLKPETSALINQKSSFVAANATAWQGIGWAISRTSTGERWDHDGALPGTAAWVFRGINGVSFAIAANHLPDDEDLIAFFTELQKSLTEAVLTIPRWPTVDQTPSYFPATAPRIAGAGVVNAASLRPGPVANESIVKVFGLNLGGGQVRVNGATVDTLWSGNGELHVAIPRSASGPTRVEVFNNGLTSNAVTIDVRPAEPALFTISGTGYGQLAALNQNGTVNSIANPAAAGSIAVLFGTGIAPPAITINRQPAQILYSGQAPGMAPGIQQINVRIPAGLPAGQLQVITTPYQQEATLAIQ